MASKQKELGDYKDGRRSPVVSAMTQDVQFPADLQSQEISFGEFKEFIKEAMNTQTVIMEEKFKKINVIKEVAEEKHNDDELVGFRELLDSVTSALLESIDRIFQKYFEQKEVEIRQPVTLEVKEGLAEAFTQSIEKQQVDSLLQNDKPYGDNSWIYRRMNELIDYTSKKSRHGGFKSEEIALKRERFLKIHQPQIKIRKSFKRKARGKMKDWKKYRKKEE